MTHLRLLLRAANPHSRPFGNSDPTVSEGQGGGGKVSKKMKPSYTNGGPSSSSQHE